MRERNLILDTFDILTNIHKNSENQYKYTEFVCHILYKYVPKQQYK